MWLFFAVEGHRSCIQTSCPDSGTRRRSANRPSLVGRSGIKQRCPAGLRPCLLLGRRQRIEIRRRGGAVVDPLAQLLAAVDEVDGETAMLVLVRKVAPQLVVRAQPAQRL